jgi:hypothetical protein
VEVGTVKIGWRDGVATLLVAAIVVPYVGYLVRGSMPFIQDQRGMTATGLVLGLPAAAVAGREAFRGTWGVAAAFLRRGLGRGRGRGVHPRREGALSEGLLAVFMVAIVVARALAELVRTRPFRSRAGRSAH